MAGPQLRAAVLLFFYCQVCCLRANASPVNIPLQSVSDSLFQSALGSLNENSPTHHTYNGGNLISAQKLVEPPYVIYRLTFNLNPICKEGVDSCPKEACTIDLRQHELGAIDVHRESIQCLYLYPQSAQDDIIQVQESIQDASFQDTSFQEPEYIESLDKQMNQSVELDHEIQPVADQNDRPFIAVRASSSNYCPGCPYELNPNLPGLLAFGEQITKSMDELLPNDFKHILVRMIKVTRAVPPSNTLVEYQLLTEIGESDCLKNTLLDPSECNLQRNVPTKICFVTFEERPWTPDGRRITKNNCTLLREGENEPAGKPGLVTESQVTAAHNRDQMQEGPSIFDIARDTLEDALTERITSPRAETAATYVDRQHSVTEEPFVKVVLNKSQDSDEPVGFTDKIKEFDEFLEDFDLPIRTSPKAEPDSSAKPVDEKVVKVQVDDRVDRNPFVRTKRSVFDDPISEKNFMNQLAQKALDSMDNMGLGNKKRIVLDTAVNLKERTPEGYVYELLLNVERTVCNEKINGVKGCVAKIPQSIQVCRMEVSTDEQQSIESARVISSKCYKDSGKRSKRMRRAENLVGAPTQKDVNDTEIIRFADLGLHKFSENSEGSNEPMIVQIKEATVQVVSGLKYKITVQLGNSDCPKGVKENCSLKDGSEIKECTFTVWSRPWLDKESPQITIDCNTNSRPTRSLRGVNYSQKMLQQVADLQSERMFKQFKRDFGKVYPSEKEEQIRFKIFRKNLRKIGDLRRSELGTGEYGITMFADLTYEEFTTRHLGLRPDLKKENNIPLPEAKIPDINVPTEFDWRQYGVVTPVKDQGGCGSCWAFSVTGNVEGQYAIKHKRLLSLSEQELVDCDKLDDGCEGGLPDNAYRAIEQIGGLELEKDYPYDAEDEKCHFNRSKATVQVVSAVNITSNETKMAQWLVQNGPISIGINANAMQFYVGGISHPFKFLCNPKNLDHGVLIVGYGIHKYPLFKKELPYWTIKNSWGPRWGEQGYYRVYRGDGTCGVNQMASSAIVA